MINVFGWSKTVLQCFFFPFFLLDVGIGTHLLSTEGDIPAGFFGLMFPETFLVTLLARYFCLRYVQNPTIIWEKMSSCWYLVLLYNVLMFCSVMTEYMQKYPINVPFIATVIFMYGWYWINWLWSLYFRSEHRNRSFVFNWVGRYLLVVTCIEHTPKFYYLCLGYVAVNGIFGIFK